MIFAYNHGCLLIGIAHLFFSMKNIRRKPDFYNTLIQAAWGATIQHWNPAAAAQRIPGWPRLVRLWWDTTNQGPLWESILGECPPMDSLLPPNSAEGKMLMLEWSRHFCGCCESIGLREEGLKQLLCFKKENQNYGKGIISLMPVPELEQQQESSLQRGSPSAFSEIVTQGQGAYLGDCLCPSPAGSWDPRFLGFDFLDANKGGCGVSSAPVWRRFAGRVKYCGWRTLSWCDLFNSWKM